ncbi:unnamed protein product [Ambrosiozyma monospora]|uniref:Unnamed protein product n=1 Tax=Ambrosiozyma monospora TaxID=43982 RepID=A0ACB5TT43_AMBMO|nr:unnamed protein product [Ambrosiozyma monospora]
MTSKHEAINPIHKSVEGKLDPTFVKIYREQVANTPNNTKIDLATLRKTYSSSYSYRQAPAPGITNVKDIKFKSFDGTEIILRIYRPNDAKPDELLPVHIDFHGGGWGLGDLDTEVHILKHYVANARIVVIDVDYRLIPEVPFPSGLKDCFEAVKFVYSHADELNVNKNSISVGGVSAGGNISLAVNHLCRDEGIKLVLVCAGTPQVSDIQNISKADESPYKSMKEFEFAPTLNWARLKWFDTMKWSSFDELSENEKEEKIKEIGWFKSILDAPNWENLTKTVIFTAGCDPMRDEGEAYCKKLIDYGNEVVFKRFPGVPHPFMHMDKDLWQAQEFIKLTSQELAIAHGTLYL